MDVKKFKPEALIFYKFLELFYEIIIVKILILGNNITNIVYYKWGDGLR